MMAGVEESEAMAMAPVPTSEVLWRKPPVLALAARMLHDASSGPFPQERAMLRRNQSTTPAIGP